MNYHEDGNLRQAVKGLEHWLEFAKRNQPDRDNYLWGVGYESAPIHSDWLEAVLNAVKEDAR